MEQGDFFADVVRKLESLCLEYLIGGSVCSMFYGRARITQDMDVVLRLPLGQLREFVGLFPEPDHYVSDIAIRGALASGGQFNVLHSPSLSKVDFFTPLPDDAFANEQFARRRRGDLGGGVMAYFASPEDLIVKKLEYYQEGGSEKHVNDLASILQVHGADLDYARIESWARRLGVLGEWQQIRSQKPE